MNTNPVGHMLLINIENYQGMPHRKRTGSEKDVARLQHTFHDLGFKLYKGKPYLDLIKKDMINIIQEFAKDPCHTNSSCSVVTIMAHGQSGGLIEASNGHLTRITDVLKLFSNDIATHLKGKPKLFIFQACRYTYAHKGQMH